MSEAKEQFFRTTRQYFMNTDESAVQTINSNSDYQPKKYYIKEDPFIDLNSAELK